MDSVNRYYAYGLAEVRLMSADSVKKMQKVNRSVNYQIRNKKN
jgi:hypothetical protein